MAQADVIYTPYGAFELKSKYQTNFLKATIIITTLIAVLLGTFYLISIFSGDVVVINNPKLPPSTPHDFDPPPRIIKPPPQFNGGQSIDNHIEVGIPTPVPDEEIDEDVFIPSQSDFRQIDINQEIPTDGNGGIYVAPQPEYIPAPYDFVPVEIDPEMIYYITPEYPRLMREAGITGDVWISVLVDKTGSVRDAIVAVTSKHTSLDKAALATAYQNKFKPAIQNGKPVMVWVTYKVEFIINH